MSLGNEVYFSSRERTKMNSTYRITNTIWVLHRSRILSNSFHSLLKSAGDVSHGLDKLRQNILSFSLLRISLKSQGIITRLQSESFMISWLNSTQPSIVWSSLVTQLQERKLDVRTIFYSFFARYLALFRFVLDTRKEFLPRSNSTQSTDILTAAEQ